VRIDHRLLAHAFGQSGAEIFLRDRSHHLHADPPQALEQRNPGRFTAAFGPPIAFAAHARFVPCHRALQLRLRPMIRGHGKAVAVTQEPGRLVSHSEQPVKLIGAEGFLGRAQQEQRHEPFGNRDMRALQDRSDRHAELLPAGAAKIDGLAQAR